MLDQNTDRMWFVIGSVIVGAAIIFIANGTMPDIFASVSSTFEDSSAKALAVVDRVGADEDYESINLIDTFSIRTGYWISQIDGRLIETGDYDGYTDNISVSPGRRYKFTGAEGREISGAVAYYDSNNQMLIRERFIGSEYNTTTAPNEADYMQISANISYTGPISTWRLIEL